MISIGLFFAALSALGNACNALVATQVINEKIFTTKKITLVSIFPSFLICTILGFSQLSSYNIKVVALIAGKNILYGMAFFLRFQGIHSLGPFQGAFLAAVQPVLVGVLSLCLLGENLTQLQWFALLVVAIALMLPTKLETREDWKSILIYAFLPALLLSLTVVSDRWVLTTFLSPDSFFIIDKITLLPSVFVSLLLFQPNLFFTTRRVALDTSDKMRTILWFDHKKWKAFAWALALALPWTLASYTYALALSHDKTALITVIRNLAFPLAAIGSAYFFSERLTRRRVIALFLVIFACILTL